MKTVKEGMYWIQSFETCLRCQLSSIDIASTALEKAHLKTVNLTTPGMVNGTIGPPSLHSIQLPLAIMALHVAELAETHTTWGGVAIDHEPA